MRLFAAILVLLSLAAPVRALKLELDFSYDTANFFGSNPVAKAALQQAANDISAVITSPLGAVSTDVFNGASGSSSATFNWKLTFKNPSTDATVTLETFTFSLETVRVYVGMRALSGAVLGEGGPGGAGVAVSGAVASGFATAVDKAEAASNAMLTRGPGPVIGSLSGSIGGEAYTVRYGAMIGNLWFDNDSNNDGAADSAVTLSNYWHFDSTTAPAAGKRDFYSVALHELLHAIGVGASHTWNSLSSGTTWLGSEAIALNGGSGLNLITGDGHIREGYMSTRLFDGAAQETAMDPNITSGTRKYLTAMDAAFLRDIGYATIPEPSATGLAAFSLALAVGSLRPRRQGAGVS